MLNTIEIESHIKTFSPYTVTRVGWPERLHIEFARCVVVLNPVDANTFSYTVMTKSRWCIDVRVKPIQDGLSAEHFDTFAKEIVGVNNFLRDLRVALELSGRGIPTEGTCSRP